MIESNPARHLLLERDGSRIHWTLEWLQSGSCESWKYDPLNSWIPGFQITFQSFPVLPFLLL